MPEPKPRFSLSELAKRLNERLATPPDVQHFPRPVGSSYIPYGVSRVDLPPEVGIILGVAAQADNIVVVDCTHGVVTITFPTSASWDIEPKLKVDLLPMPTAGMGF